MKKIISITLCLFCALVLSVFCIGLYRTYSLNTPDIHFAQTTKEDTLKPTDTSILHLQKAIQTPAVSNKDYDKTDFKQFDNFLSFLKNTYPDVFSKLQYIPINKYAILLIWKSDKKSDKLPILLTGHYDTVGADIETIKDWKYPPFEGALVDGKIFGRGTLDDRTSFIAIFEAIDSLIKEGFEPDRDIYFAFGQDEETGGVNGAKKIAEYLEKNNVKFEMVMDEGGRVEIDNKGNKIAFVGISEKGRYAFEILVKSKGGHASRPLKTSSVVKLGKLVQILNENQMKPALTSEVLEYYKKTISERDFYTKFLIANADVLEGLLLNRLSKTPEDNANVRTTTAFTQLTGAGASNIIPDIAIVVGDFRIIPSQTKDDIENHIKNVLSKKAPEIDYEIRPFFDEAPSNISPIDNGAYKKLSEIINKNFSGAKVVPFMVSGGTDARQYNKVSNSVYRFLPMVLTEEDHALMHGINEFITVENYARAIKFYKDIISQFY